jgi:hypothetical protein
VPFGARVVWSSFDPGTATYRLMTRFAGVTSVVPVAPRKAPFDVDLGPNRSGDTVAAYARCHTDPALNTVPIRQATARGCDLYEFNFATGREARLAAPSTRSASEVLPSMWRNEVAFVRIYERRKGRAGALPHLYVRRLTGRGPARRQRSGPRGNFGAPQLGSLDLSGAWLAFQWSYVKVGDGHSEIRLDRVGRGQRRLASQVTTHGGIVNRNSISPTIAGGYVYWARMCWGDQTLSRYLRYRIDTRRLQKAAAPDSLVSLAQDGRASYYSRALGFVGDPPFCASEVSALPGTFPPACEIAQGGQIAFR